MTTNDWALDTNYAMQQGVRRLISGCVEAADGRLWLPERALTLASDRYSRLARTRAARITEHREGAETPARSRAALDDITIERTLALTDTLRHVGTGGNAAKRRPVVTRRIKRAHAEAHPTPVHRRHRTRGARRHRRRGRPGRRRSAERRLPLDQLEQPRHAAGQALHQVARRRASPRAPHRGPEPVHPPRRRGDRRPHRTHRARRRETPRGRSYRLGTRPGQTTPVRGLTPTRA